MVIDAKQLQFQLQHVPFILALEEGLLVLVLAHVLERIRLFRAERNANPGVIQTGFFHLCAVRAFRLGVMLGQGTVITIKKHV